MSGLASVSEASVLRVMAGMARVPGGTSHSCVTATMSSPSPRANRMSVALGSSEQILMAWHAGFECLEEGNDRSRPPLPPPLLEDHVLEWQPLGPPAALQLGVIEKRLGVAETQIGHRQNGIRYPEDPTEGLNRQDADPADADALGACREPEVLDRAARAVDVSVDDGVAAEDMGTTACPVACHADVDRGFVDSFELQAAIERGPFSVIVRAGSDVLLGERGGHLLLRLRSADDDKVPRLHEPD